MLCYHLSLAVYFDVGKSEVRLQELNFVLNKLIHCLALVKYFVFDNVLRPNSHRVSVARDHHTGFVTLCR